MIKKLFLGVCLSSAASLAAFEESPWFGNLWEFRADFDYRLSHYSTIENAVGSGKSLSTDNLVKLDLGTYFSNVLSDELQPSWNPQVELEIAKTTGRDLNVRSLAFLMRKLLQDDLGAGDPFSLAVGVSGRYVPKSALDDPSTPYHGSGNFELSGSIGKEITSGHEWLVRPYFLGSLGFSGRGSFFSRTDLVFRFNCNETIDLELFAKGYFGFGNKKVVDLSHFHGFAGIAHRSIDLGIVASYKILYEGTINLELSRRVYAHAFPKENYAISLSYTLPFTVF